MDIRFLLVDALNLIRRVYAAQPGDDGPERAQSALHSCAQSLQRALKEARPTHAVCVFEGEGPSWRYRAYLEYKAGRTPMPQALLEALKTFESAFLDQGVFSFRLPGVEADDVIATLAVKAASRQGRVTILSTDKVFLQLLSDRIAVRDHFGQRDLDTAHVREKFGVDPGRFGDFLALCGDSTNNIKGVPGVGAKTAARLLSEHGNLEAVLANAGTIGGRIGPALEAHRDRVLLAHDLVRLRTDLELGVNLKFFRCARAGGAAGPDS
jgi:protein Xni